MKKYVALLISIAPVSILRIVLYNKLMGYKISYSSTIGLGTIFANRTVLIRGAKIGMFNTYMGKFDLVIDEGTDIGNLNEFHCASRDGGYCKIGKNVHITRKHFFDTTGGK